MRLARLLLRLLPVVAVLAVAVPGSSVQPTTLSLTRTGEVTAYDFSDGVVWVLVLGLDPEGSTDLVELLGVDAGAGRAAAIGIPRDTWFELTDEVGEARINEAYAEGPDVAAAAVDRLVGIEPDYVMATDEAGFLEMVGTLGGVTVQSENRFTTEGTGTVVHVGANDLDPREALDFAVTRALPRGDRDRVRNHQALLLGLLERLHERDDEPGLVEELGLAAVSGIDTDNLSPLDLYRLLNALTAVQTGRTGGCVVPGTDDTSPAGGAIIVPDRDAALRLGDDVRDDARFDGPCPPGG